MSRKNACQWCGGQFGLIRHYINAWRKKAFCSKRCKEKHLSYYRKKRTFLRWLYEES